MRTLLLVLLAASTAVSAADESPHSVTGVLEPWPWQLEYEAVVVAAEARKDPVYVAALDLTVAAVPRSGPRETHVDGKGVMLEPRVGAKLHDEFQADTLVYRLGAPAGLATLKKGERIRYWCCRSTAPNAPGWLIEVVPAKVDRTR